MTERLRVVVVDDEGPALEDLAYLLGRDDRVEVVATCDRATTAVEVLRGHEVEAVFLDIAMPGLTGLDLAAVLGRAANPPAIVFVTAHAEHAVDAFEVNAVDYLLKPVREERLREAVRRLCEAGAAGGDAESGRGEDAIAVELGGVTRLIPRSEVRYVEAQGDYSRLHTATGSHLVRVPISGLEERWRDAGFLRIHRSYLVALGHVVQVREIEGRVQVRIGHRELAVSRRHAPELREQLRRTRRGQQ
ncbi:MAG: LytTR family DNA-binding domain-containing protein [Nocardioides sp.]|uniref:LytR/AlgR family response regulator transcription factor n=1 Tax=Nocardioides sp. TaxID=35761 RepID=UPI0039E5D4C7